MRYFFNTYEKRIGFVLTLFLHILLLILFFYSGLKYMDPPLNEGSIAIVFGETDYGKDINNSNIGGNVSKNIKEDSQEEEVLTQEIEEAPIISKKINKKINQDIKQEDPKPDKKISKTISNFFSNNKNKEEGGGSKGDDDKYGYKGSKKGDKNSNSYSGNGSGGNGNYKLGNRKPLNKPKPKYDGNDQGTVVVRIIVDKYGNVIKADIEMKGTTITDSNLWEQAKTSAMDTKWEPSDLDNRVEGLIIYSFLID